MSGAVSCQPMCLVGEDEALFCYSRRKFAIDHETSMDVLEENTSWVDQPVVVVDVTAPLVFIEVERVADVATTTSAIITANSSIAVATANNILSTIITTPVIASL